MQVPYSLKTKSHCKITKIQFYKHFDTYKFENNYSYQIGLKVQIIIIKLILTFV